MVKTKQLHVFLLEMEYSREDIIENIFSVMVETILNSATQTLQSTRLNIVKTHCSQHPEMFSAAILIIELITKETKCNLN